MARTALIAGAVGRLGESVLNRALAIDAYDHVVALAEAPMNLGIRRLSLASQDNLPPLNDLFLVLSDPAEPSSRSFYGRDAAFTLLDDNRLPRVAAQAARAGARRVLLLSPLPAWQQMSGFHHGLAGERESALAALPFDSLTIMRPVKSGGALAGGFVQRVSQMYLSIQLAMMPKSIPTLTSDQLAKAAFVLMEHARDGIRILDAAQIESALAGGSNPA